MNMMVGYALELASTENCPQVENIAFKIRFIAVDVAAESQAKRWV